MLSARIFFLILKRGYKNIPNYSFIRILYWKNEFLWFCVQSCCQALVIFVHEWDIYCLFFYSCIKSEWSSRSLCCCIVALYRGVRKKFEICRRSHHMKYASCNQQCVIKEVIYVSYSSEQNVCYRFTIL